MDKLGVGIIGAGNISGAYLRLGPLFKALEMKAVADINTDAAAAKAEEYGVEALSVEDMLARDDIHVVVNLTIPAVHYQVSHNILAAGKHAYSEKPLVLTLEEGEALKKFAAEQGLRVGSAPDTFLGGAHQLARAAIDEGLVGRIVGGTAHVMSHGMEAWHPNPDFFFQPGAGPVLDVGPYYVTNLIQLIGPVKRVTAFASATFPTRTIGSGPREGETVPVDTPTNIHSVLEFENGAIVSHGASWDVWSHGHSPMELYGENGSIYVPDPNFFGGAVEVTGPDKDRRVLEERGHPFGIPNQEERANYRCAGLADMAQGIADGRKHRCDIDLAVHAVDVMTSILKAAESGEVITLSTTCERPAALSPEEATALMA
ncbi:Gfo/Idh/MocA family protein [Pelagovum pacificum]|uniref:Gfo/Idh/MocA family oxidoreductase n=1 Tax=Pelagovum pacificum TaxID=2588711 RepID=A0A5C5GIZ4_9RHOB|nr:Gfo/Idh/MocA family oxidoreductase [Pelagovum pacificum]QQA42665.1 Gfo/Idh/MocA family oxidoreductase [Pelagovum pacificum]TNY34184.1 Gfo/Idh/MocA family oxidoreductase [Pelagovum pacificum]